VVVVVVVVVVRVGLVRACLQDYRRTCGHGHGRTDGSLCFRPCRRAGERTAAGPVVVNCDGRQ